jgi:hypothetical protein
MEQTPAQHEFAAAVLWKQLNSSRASAQQLLLVERLHYSNAAASTLPGEASQPSLHS